MKEWNIVELFGGIGAIRKALLTMNVPFKVIDYVEIDKNCVKSYNQLYDEHNEPKSVVDYELPDERIDILMHGSPCQDFSRIGMKKGGAKDSGTRSSLLFETIRIIETAPQKPRWVIWENVKGVLDKRMRDAFFYYLQEMERLGYETKYEVLKALDYGIPQYRERVFAISYLGKNSFDFTKLEKKPMRPIREFLEKEVSDKYLVTQPYVLKFLDENFDSPFKKRLKVIDKYCYTISTKQVRVPNAGIINLGNGRYRYLTELECFRLMGFDDEDFRKLRKIYKEKDNTKSSILYKQAGNSVVVGVMEVVLKKINNKERIFFKENDII